MNKLLIIIIILITLNLILFNKEKFTENKKNLTIVTAYFKVNRTRVVDEYTNGRKQEDMPKDSDGIYKEWMKGLLSYNGPMIIYTDEHSFDYLTDLRKNYPKEDLGIIGISSDTTSGLSARFIKNTHALAKSVLYKNSRFGLPDPQTVTLWLLDFFAS